MIGKVKNQNKKKDFPFKFDADWILETSFDSFLSSSWEECEGVYHKS